MVAVRNLLSTLNGLAHAGLMAGGWLRAPQGDVLAKPLDDPAGARPLDDGPYAQAGVEPPLEELLQDPLVRLLMRADHLDPDQVRRLVTSERQRRLA